MEREKLENNAESAQKAAVNDNQLSVSEKLTLVLFDTGENEFGLVLIWKKQLVSPA